MKAYEGRCRVAKTDKLLEASQKRVERLMREQNLKTRVRRMCVTTTDSRHSLSVSENMLNRNFHAAYPREKWVSNITYLWTNTRLLYLTVILDLWDRKVVD